MGSRGDVRPLDGGVAAIASARTAGVSLYEIIERSAAAGLPEQRADGSMAPGHNGPYHDAETPVRNTSHWLITFLKAHEISGDGRFLDAAHRAASYLCGPEARPMGASFWHRKNPVKDFCNGLIGQAWTIEALALGGTALEIAELARTAEAVFLLHPFDEERGLWRRVGVDGAYLPLDLTFNHQLWFAAAGALIGPGAQGQVGRRVQRFIDRLGHNMRLYRSGLIRHPVAATRSFRARAAALGRGLGRPARRALERKSFGYHAFNLYAFGMMAPVYPDHAFWKTDTFRKTMRYLETAELVGGLDGNAFGYPYNPAGFEAAFALHSFSAGSGGGATPDMIAWVRQQLDRCYDFESHRMSLGTEDPLTHAARLHEATRLPDMPLGDFGIDAGHGG